MVGAKVGATQHAIDIVNFTDLTFIVLFVPKKCQLSLKTKIEVEKSLQAAREKQ